MGGWRGVFAEQDDAVHFDLGGEGDDVKGDGLVLFFKGIVERIDDKSSSVSVDQGGGAQGGRAGEAAVGGLEADFAQGIAKEIVPLAGFLEKDEGDLVEFGEGELLFGIEGHAFGGQDHDGILIEGQKSIVVLEIRLILGEFGRFDQRENDGEFGDLVFVLH